MNEETEKIRIEINELCEFARRKIVKIIFITLALFSGAVVLSFLQPVFIADKIVTLLAIIEIFEVGILGGFVMSESIREETFKVYKNKRKEKAEK